MNLSRFLLAPVMMITIVSCQNQQKTSDATTGDSLKVVTSTKGTAMSIDTSASKLQWKGTKLIGEGHNGTIKLSSGSIQIEGQQIIGGQATLNMHSIQPTDGDQSSNEKLKAHLSSSDFFAVDSFPTAQFDIVDVKLGADTANGSMKDATHTIIGNLKIKGISKSISIPAKINISDKLVQISTDFIIDRTNWGINYGSENSVKNKIINKEVEFNIQLVANK